MSESKPGVDRQGSHARCATNVPQDPRPGTFPGGLPHLAGSSRNTQWGSRDLNPGPTDYENVQTLFEGVRHGPFRAQDADIQTI